MPHLSWNYITREYQTIDEHGHATPVGAAEMRDSLIQHKAHLAEQREARLHEVLKTLDTDA